MSSVLLTEFVIKSAKCRPTQYEICDNKVRGLALRISPGGAKTFVFLYKFHRHNRRMTLGRSDAITLADARGKAQNALSAIANGIDPQIERKNAAMPAFGNVAAEYLQHPSTKAKKN